MTYATCCGKVWTSKSYASHTSHHARTWPTTEEKFERRVVRGAGCWLWVGGHNSHGYGTVNHNKRRQYAHRVAWEMAYGPIPDGMGVLHRCDNPPCVRPDHLFLGGQKLNGEDMAAKDRSTHGSKNPAAKLTESDVMDILRSDEPMQRLADKYGVNHTAIWMIKRGVRWTRVFRVFEGGCD